MEFEKPSVTNLIEEFEKEEKISLKNMIYEVLELAFPMICFFWVMTIEQTITYYFIVRKYPDQEKIIINSLGIINTFMNTVFMSLSFGLLAGVDILCSNALGKKDYYLVGVYWNRGKIISFSFSLVFGIFVFIYGPDVLEIFVSDPQILADSSQYIKISVFSSFVMIIFEANSKYLNIINKATISMGIYIITILTHPIWCYIFISWFDLAILGAGISIFLTNFCNVILSTLYIHIYDPCPGSYFWYNSDCFKGLYDYLKFTFPSLLLVCLEWWAFEIQSVIAFFTDVTDYNTYLIGLTLLFYFLSITAGFSVATTIIIGRMIIQNSFKSVKKAMSVILICGNICSLTFLLYLYTYKYAIFSILVDPIREPVVFQKSQSLIPIFIVIVIFDFQSNMLSSMMKGFNLQKIASIINFIGFYIIQTTVTLILVFKYNYGMLGCWIGICSGSIFNFITYSIICLTLDLQKIKENINERMEVDKNKLEFN